MTAHAHEALTLAEEAAFRRAQRVARDARICQLAGKGYSTMEIARQVDCAMDTVRRALRAAGVGARRGTVGDLPWVAW